MPIEPLNGTTVPQQKKYISESAVNCYAASNQQQADTFEMTSSPSFQGGDEKRNNIVPIIAGSVAGLGLGVFLGRTFLPKKEPYVKLPPVWP